MKRKISSLVLTLLVAGAATAVRPSRALAAGPNDRAAWTVRVRMEQLESLVPWNGRLAGADRFGGLVVVEPATGEWEVLTTREGLTVNDLRDLAVDAQQNLWVATAGGGIVRFDAQGAARPVTGLLDPNVSSLATEGDVVFYGTSSAGAGRVVGELPDATYTAADGLVDQRVRAVGLHAGRAWFGTQAGVSEFTANVFTTRHQGLGLVFVYDLIAGAAGVFVATDLGVHRFDDGAQAWVQAGSGLVGGIRALAFDGDDVLALAFAGAGQQQFYRLASGSSAWEATAVAADSREYSCVVAAAPGDAWLAGRVVDSLAINQDPRAILHRLSPATDVVVRTLFGAHVQGPLAIDSDGAGGAWIGMEAPRSGLNHLSAGGSLSAYPFLEATAGTGFCSTQSKRAVKRARDGSVWISAINACVTRLVPHASDDPLQATFTHYNESNSGIQMRAVVAIAEDSRGRLWFLSDGRGDDGELLNNGLDILLNPSDPVALESWVHLRAGSSELAGDELRHVTFGADGVAWLCITGVGIQRWDTDGPDGSESIASTAQNPFRWDRIDENRLVLSGIRGMDLLNPSAVAVAADASLWLATTDEGLLHLDYAGGFPWRQLDRVQQRLFGPGLLSASVNALAIDNAGDVWAATASGLNRVRGTGIDLVVDAFTTLPAFDGQLYTPDVISPLPGSNVLSLHHDAAANLLHVGTQTGYASIQLAGAPAAPEESQIFLYPNPLHAGHAGVRVAGFTGTATVQVFTILGVEVARQAGVQAGDLAWDGRYISSSAGTTEDLPAASGLYVVVVDVDGTRIQRTLAIER